MKDPNENYWNYCLGVTYEHVDKYSNAITYYKEALAKESNDVVAYRLANCYNDLGNYEKALYYCEQAISLDSTDTDYIFYKANIEDNAGRTMDAISTMDKFLQQTPDYAFGYYRRGWFKDHSGDIDGAIEDYTLCITMEPDYAYTYLNRGVLYRLKGDMSAAEKDFKQVIRLDSVPDEMECAQYAYYYLDNKEKAISIVNEMLKRTTRETIMMRHAYILSWMKKKSPSVIYAKH